jgi:hypothetical protein
MATGQVQRGMLIALGVLGLFFGGIFIGGIDVVDSEEDQVWFFGEALVGPIAFGVNAAHQNLFKAYDPSVLGVATQAELNRAVRRSAYPDEMRVLRAITIQGRSVTIPVFQPAAPGKGPPNKKSISKVNELGTLFATIAGMMNVIALIDAAFPSPRRKTPDNAAAAAATGAAAVLGVGVVKTKVEVKA